MIMRLFFLLLCCTLSLPALAGDTLEIANAWVRPTLGNSKISAAYMTITNNSDDDIIVTNVTSSRVETIEIHMTSMDEQGIMSMDKLDALSVPAHGAITLAPGGTHLMILGIKKLLQEGDSFTLTLHTNSGDTTKVKTLVKKM